ncbi:conserved exported protein of unknown function [Rhodovastum atsumiense]|uniref:Rap1a immunity protein domain-containing protein n=1 Tax=Rhodovastum atsumiense TaxID=504468 RepID=A0A5M6IRJ6_9PROT|nr:hypothetical protein [Rhodovastum atsumiense]KAA5610517.1 hypothetical protein F1189_18705 [Rhodovastum atsumiense]CAH2605042.1 conserved exported protein of unknown function [Rhodovastum atsumiense]
MRRLLLAAVLVLVPPTLLRADRPDAPTDYSTATRAEYVFTCMAVNGGTRDALQRCACAIDVIASLLPRDRYEAAETVLRMRRDVGGYLAQQFRTGISNDIVRDLDEAQAEAEVRCF